MIGIMKNTLNDKELNIFRWQYPINRLCPLPHRYRFLSGCYTSGAETVRVLLQTVLVLFQAHEAEFHLTPGTDHAFTLFFVMLHQHATGGTGSDAGTAVDPLHVLEDDVRTVFQYVQRIWAAVIVTAVWARSPTFPFPQTLPAEPISPSLADCAHRALYIQIGEVISHHTRLATRTLWRKVTWKMSEMFPNSLL